MMYFLSRILGALICGCITVCCSGGVHERVIFAIDKKHGLNPSSDQVLSHRLFDFRYVSSRKYLDEHVDMFAHANWSVAREMLPDCHFLFLDHVFLSDDVYDLFENKARWKTWMKTIGLEKFIAKSINIGDNYESIPYPVVVKSSRKQFGEGVKVILSPKQLMLAIEDIPKLDQDTVVIEESLMGMGLCEMTSFGSAFEGKLLSLRCTYRCIDSDSNPGEQRISTGETVTVPFVRSNDVKFREDHGVACGQDLVSAVSTMMAHTTYTGPFCVDWKQDSQGQAKMMEVNARMCGTQRKIYGDAYVISALVPLSFAFLEHVNNSTYRDRSALLHSQHRTVYREILQQEQRALQTGGGMFPEGWREVPSFDKNLWTVPLLDTYHAIFRAAGFDYSNSSAATLWSSAHHHEHDHHRHTDDHHHHHDPYHDHHHDHDAHHEHHDDHDHERRYTHDHLHLHPAEMEADDPDSNHKSSFPASSALELL